MIIQVSQILIPYAQDAFIPVPHSIEQYNASDYPHWNLFNLMHLGQKFSDTLLTHNAHVISRIPDDEVLDIPPSQLAARGLLR